MTSNELSLQFDRLYDDATASAPGVNEYEKSMFLTIAQDKLIDKYLPLIEVNPLSAEVLASLIKHNVEPVVVDDIGKLVKSTQVTRYGITSYFFNKPNDLVKLLHGQLETNKNIVQVTPLLYKSIAKTVNNPFRAESNSRA